MRKRYLWVNQSSRDITERPGGVKIGTTRLVGTDTQSIISQVELLLNDQNEYNNMAKAVNPYGDGNTSKLILKRIKKLTA